MEEFEKMTFRPMENMEDHNKSIAEHAVKHYRKYLFGIGAATGFIISLMTWVIFNTNTINNRSNAGYETGETTEISALAIFDKIDALAHEKDNFFHQEGKIYSLSGDTIFHKYDTIFHVLDASYHQAQSIKEKLKRAKRLSDFIPLQDKLFSSTEYLYPEKDAVSSQLNKNFQEMLSEIGKSKISTGTKTITEENENIIDIE